MTSSASPRANLTMGCGGAVPEVVEEKPQMTPREPLTRPFATSRLQSSMT